MTEKMNKIQIRADVFSSINGVLSSNDYGSNNVNSAIEKLKKIEDKNFLAKLLLKEFIDSKNPEHSALITILLLNCVPLEDVEKHLWSNLSLKNLSDEKKYQLIDILKSMGKFIEYDEYLDYFEEPEKIVEMDTQRLLSSALLNPEAQVDFLDFTETLAPKDKLLLIQSMIEDYSKDDLVNIISPIIFSEKDELIIETVIKELINARSALSYYPLKNFSTLSRNEILKKLANKGLKELQIAGINQDTTQQYYKKRFNNSILHECYVSLPDGKGNIGLIFSRIRSDNSIQFFCVIINDTKGITDCFGFNGVSSIEFSLIVKKFSENKNPFKLTFEMGLKWLNKAEFLSFENNNSLPYEYICWKNILFDVADTSKEDEDIIIEALEILPSKECDLDTIFKTNYLEKLFFRKQDNQHFDELIKEIDNDIALAETINLEQIETKLKENITNIFDKEVKNIFIKRLQKTAFILMSNSDNKTASQIYELTKNENLLNEFFLEVLKKSFFVFYQQEFQNKVNNNQDNIFLQKSQENKTKIDLAKIKLILDSILDEWGEDE